MKVTLEPVQWPPLLKGEGLPRWVLVRDTCITLLAWAVLAFLLRDIFWLAVDYFEYPFFQLTNVAPPDMALLWSRLRPYTELIVFFMGWLLVSVLVWRLKFRGRQRQAQPEALLIAQHAQAFGVNELDVLDWQQSRVQVLQLSPDGRFVAGPSQAPGVTPALVPPP